LCRKRKGLKVEFGHDVEKMEQSLREYIMDNHMEQSLIALDIATRMHRGQKRAGGLPYIIHPMTMACHAISLGQTEDDLIAVMLLHDVCEDCSVEPERLPVNETVLFGVKCMTHIRREGESKEESMAQYMQQLRQSREACLVKLFDRCNNVSSMSGAFSREKLISYTQETKKYIYPLFQYVRETYEEYHKTVFALEYHITSVLDSIVVNA
jgi:GTP pyrophosphokinase